MQHAPPATIREASPLGRVLAIERATLNAIPAPRQRFLGPLILRAFHGGTGRANAAMALAPEDVSDPLVMLEEVRRFYDALGIRPRLRSTPLDPPGLSEAARAAGWRDYDESLVLHGSLSPIAQQEAALEVLTTPEERWMAVLATAEHQVEARRREKREGAALMAVPCAWLLLEDAASLFVVADGPLCGIFDLAVRPEARRRGLARRIVAAGADWALRQGCTHGYLQVSATNHASLALNTGMGFGESHRYRYLSPR